MRVLRAVGALLLAAVVCGGSIHASWDDVACDPSPVHHNHDAHRLRAGTLPSGAQDHCLFCHSLRSLGNGLVIVHAVVADSAPAATIRPSNVVLASLFLDSSAPSRAPPALA